MSDNLTLEQLNDLDLTSVDLSRPLVKDGTTLRAVLTKFEAKPNSKSTGHNLNITLLTAEPVTGDDGKTINEGFGLYDLVSLVQTEKYDPKEKLAMIQVAVYGEQRKGFLPADYIGKEVLIKVFVEEDTGFGRKNRIQRYLKKPATATL